MIGACSEFATVASFESQINLFYNQRLNLDLSEQMKIDCQFGTGPLNISSSNMLVDELCSSFVNRDIFCNGEFQSTQEEMCCDIPYLCNDWQNRTWIKSNFGLDCTIPPTGDNSMNCFNISNVDDFNTEEKIEKLDKEVKKLLISKGPIDAYIPSMKHSMVLIGYKENKSDWKTIQLCIRGLEMCVAEMGCVSFNCNPGDNDLITYNFHPTKNITEQLTYSCREYDNTGVYVWTLIRNELSNQSIIPNRTCDPLGLLTIGPHWIIPQTFVEYNPKNGETIWIFRDSQVNAFPEIALDAREFGALTIPSGPYTLPNDKSYWPINFNNSVKCFDKDNDGYCNWGISDIGLNTSWRNLNCPNSCVNTPNLRKDCNDVDVAIGPFDENFSCKKIFCNDSDNGVNNFLKGFVYTNYNAQNPRTRIYDSCMILTELWIGNFSCSGNECWVQDYYCQGGVRGPYGSLYNCPNGCRNGACI